MIAFNCLGFNEARTMGEDALKIAREREIAAASPPRFASWA